MATFDSPDVFELKAPAPSLLLVDTEPPPLPTSNPLITASLVDVKTVDVDGEYDYDEEVIEISITINPNLDRKILEELHFELNEIIRHELEHIIQFERGDDIPKKEPRQPIKYYTQPHELQAQIAGFKRRAQKEKKPLEDVIRSWFANNKLKHRLSPKNIEVVINRILELN